jgi:hypothetical protein
MPPTEVIATDAYSFTFMATSGGHERGVTHDLPANFTTIGSRSAVLGPTLNSPTITTIGTSPNVRLRAQVGAQSAYSGTMSLIVRGATSKNEVEVTVTSGYAGAASSAWDVSVPDLTPSGFNSAWGIQPGEQPTWMARGASERRLRGRNLSPLLFATMRLP